MSLSLDLPGERRSGTLGSDPDAQRALTALGDRTILAGVLAPAHLGAALTLFDVPLAERLARAGSDGTHSRPIFLAASSDDGVLRLEIRARSGAVADAVRAVAPFVEP
jgi:hypothetical protein